MGIFSAAGAQKVDSIYFHLYTDSLKKGQHNYINVDGKLSNGSWMPVNWSMDTLRVNGNTGILADNCGQSVTIAMINYKG